MSEQVPETREVGAGGDESGSVVRKVALPFLRSDEQIAQDEALAQMSADEVRLMALLADKWGREFDRLTDLEPRT